MAEILKKDKVTLNWGYSNEDMKYDIFKAVKTLDLAEWEDLKLGSPELVDELAMRDNGSIVVEWGPLKSFVVVQLLSQLFATPWTAASQSSLSFTIFQSLLKFMSTEPVMPSNHLILWHHLLLPSLSFPASGSFPMSQFFASGGQSIGASTSASVLPMNIQDWFPLGLTGLIPLQSNELSRIFSSTTVQKHEFFGAQPFLLSYSHICTWLLEKPQLWLYSSFSAKKCLCFLVCCLGWS